MNALRIMCFVLLATVLALFIFIMSNLNPVSSAPAYVSPVTAEQAATPEYQKSLRWVQDVADRAGLEFPVTPEITDIGNCATGCTTSKFDKKANVYYDVISIKISPSVIGTMVGEHVVLHELAHAYGVVDECEAEHFAHAHGSHPLIFGKNTCFKQ